MNIIATNKQFKHIQSWSNSTPPDNYAILPDTIDTTEFYQYNGCVDLTIENNIVTAMTPNVEAWEEWQATLPDPAIAKAEEVRAERDALLTACDWTQMPDSPLDDDTKALWATYRQALRDVPEQEGFPMDVVWPVAPDSEATQ